MNPSGDGNYIDLQGDISGKTVYQGLVTQSPEAIAYEEIQDKPHGNLKEYEEPYLEPNGQGTYQEIDSEKEVQEYDGLYLEPIGSIEIGDGQVGNKEKTYDGAYLTPIKPEELLTSNEYIEIIT